MFVKSTAMTVTSSHNPSTPKGQTMIVEMGTHRTVVMQNNRRQVIRHNPSRDWRDVLTQYGEIVLKREVGGAPVVHDPVQDLLNAIFNPNPPAAEPTVSKRSPMLSVEDARNVLDNPLLRLPGTNSGIVRGISLRCAEDMPLEGSRPSLGQYRDFRDKPRSLPQLHCETIMGVLLQPGALGDGQLDEAALTEMAKAASRYRRSQKVYGGDCGPESVELYVRIFRALGLDLEGLAQMSAPRLERFYLAYLRVHAA